MIVPLSMGVLPTQEINSVTIEQSKAFIHNFCQEVQQITNSDYAYVVFTEEQIQQRTLFLNTLEQEGVAEIEGTADLCRGVCVSSQAAIEENIARKARSGEITDVNVYVITPLPCTPLRTARAVIDSSQPAAWKDWTVQIRSQTYRDLREAGATTYAVYTASQYAANPSPVYEAEKLEDRTVDCPIDQGIPKELIGALYTFKDSAGIAYIIATQGLQIQQHGEEPKDCWKKWFGAVGTNAAVDQRYAEMMALVPKKV